MKPPNPVQSLRDTLNLFIARRNAAADIVAEERHKTRAAVAELNPALPWNRTRLKMLEDRLALLKRIDDALHEKPSRSKGGAA
ncbi:MAG: hypothetical protein EOO54_03775 [Haliea sp.]|nr:MAG: hypothetical protein EOO54_03775 [Haliea sp.]